MQLAHYLRRRKLTTSDFANLIGVDVSTVRRYMSGARLPIRAHAIKIAEATGYRVTPNDFFFPNGLTAYRANNSRQDSGRPDPQEGRAARVG